MLRLPAQFLLLSLLTAPAAAMADDPADEGPARPVPQTHIEARPMPAGCAPAVARPPAYIEGWGRLAEFTRSDPLVFPQAYRMASRRWRVAWQLGLPFLLGSGVALVSGYERLENDHWTDATKWGLASGLGLAVASLVTAWVLLPDRDDFLAVVNQWNARNPDRPVVP